MIEPGFWIVIEPGFWIGVLIGIFLVSRIKERIVSFGRQLRGDEPEVDPVEQRLDELQERYTRGEISIEEFEHRAEIVLDPEKRHVRGLVEQVDGIGPELSEQIAHQFPDPEALKQADREELETINGIGEERSDQLLRITE